MEEPDLQTVKEQYNNLRKIERSRIAEALRKAVDADGVNLFSKVSTAQGAYNYGGIRLHGRYNLGNWKYIEAECKGKYVLISLQCFDIDPRTHNVHVLFDRIGLLLEEPALIPIGSDHTLISDALIKMETTRWELPLKNNEIEDLIGYIVASIEKKYRA